MKNKLITNIIEGLVVAVMGVLIAVKGGGSALDVYFAIVCLVLGAALAIVALVGVVQTKLLDFGLTILASIFIFIGAFLFTDWLSFAMLINLLVIVLLGLGTGLVLCGVYSVIRKALPLGIGQIVIGAAIIVFTVLYLTVPDFRTVFWIVIGIIVALYGVLLVVFAFINNSKRK